MVEQTFLGAESALLELRGRPILVTGGGGFVGTHLCRRALEAGAEVHAIGRSLGSPNAGGDESDAADLSPKVIQHRADLAEFEDAAEVIRRIRPEYVFHLAGYPFASRKPEAIQPALRSNLLTTVNLLSAISEHGERCKRVVMVGSLEEPTGDSAEIVPSSPYAASKFAATCYARMFHALYNVPIVVARTFMIYGSGQRDLSKLIPYVTSSLLRGESPKLSSGARPVDWIHVQDVADGLIAMALAPGVEGQTIDLGTGELTTVRDVAVTLAELLDTAAKPLLGALPDRPMEQCRRADVEQTAARTGWRPQIPLREGLQRTVEWYRQELPRLMVVGAVVAGLIASLSDLDWGA